MNKKITPSNYLKDHIYEEVPVIIRKKRKIKSEDFIIPEYEEYENLCRWNFNRSQLKEMARMYKQKLSGNKSELIYRIYNFLKYSCFAQKIQKCFRGYIRREYNDLHGPAYFDRKKCNNTTDFITLMKIKDISNCQFFSIEDKDKFIYGFDICSIYNLICIQKARPLNPYNRNVLSGKYIDNIRKIIRLSPLFKENIIIRLEDSYKHLTAEKRLQLRTISIFQKIDELGNYSNADWFLYLNRQLLLKFVKELVEIWYYRAALSPQTRQKICPPSGNPFVGLNILNSEGLPTSKLRRKILNVLEIFVTKGLDRDAKTLGALYVLTALTLVSKEAAESRPELYESAVQPQ